MVKRRILVVDNYDSFTYNLVQYLGEMDVDISVFRNDKITISQIRRMRPDRIVISPGPGEPSGAGISNDCIRAFAGTIPVLGVCLGHQCIGYAFGGHIVRSKVLMHGKTSEIHHDGKGIFRGVPNPFEATRYHSLVVERASLPSVLAVTATTKDRQIMGLRHKVHPVFGVQFHPESILTSEGKKILRNFLEISR